MPATRTRRRARSRGEAKKSSRGSATRVQPWRKRARVSQRVRGRATEGRAARAKRRKVPYAADRRAMSPARFTSTVAVLVAICTSGCDDRRRVDQCNRLIDALNPHTDAVSRAVEALANVERDEIGRAHV